MRFLYCKKCKRDIPWVVNVSDTTCPQCGPLLRSEYEPIPGCSGLPNSEICPNTSDMMFELETGESYGLCSSCFANPPEKESPRTFRNILSDLIIHVSIFIAPSCSTSTFADPKAMVKFLNDMKKTRRYRLSESLIQLALFIDPTQDETP